MVKREYNKQSTFIVIAAFNESKSIFNVIKNLKYYGYENIVVVDDCSKDNTYEIALNEGAHVLRHVINRGQGAALKTGIDYAILQKAKFIVTFDADGQHRVEDLERMVTPVWENKCDITIGSRFLSKRAVREMPLSRRIILKIGVIILFFFYGVIMTDAHNGFRVMNRRAAKKIEIVCDRMAHASEIVEEIHRKKLRYKEIPVIINYNEYTLKHGHGSFVGGIKVAFNMLVKKIAR